MCFSVSLNFLSKAGCNVRFVTVPVSFETCNGHSYVIFRDHSRDVHLNLQKINTWCCFGVVFLHHTERRDQNVACYFQRPFLSLIRNWQVSFQRKKQLKYLKCMSLAWASVEICVVYDLLSALLAGEIWWVILDWLEGLHLRSYYPM